MNQVDPRNNVLQFEIALRRKPLLQGASAAPTRATLWNFETRELYSHYSSGSKPSFEPSWWTLMLQIQALMSW